ncbi:hypothetical protein [Hyphomicrobium sp. MC8b]|uniref:hypothetical protein n=1 Tax=Hyphomicrobium sp. MC8b TaxID=300273 RepID=UPI003919F01C
MTDVGKLRGKGAPPPIEEAPRNIEKPPREKTELLKPLQVWVPESVWEGFSIEAVRSGSGKGAKSELFLTMWKRYMGVT